MERLKNHNTSPSCPRDSPRSGAKSSHSRPSQHSKTTTSSRRQVSDDSSPERRPSRTWSLDEYHSRHYGNSSVSSAPRASVSRKRDLSRSRDFSRSCEGDKEKLGQCQEDMSSAQPHEDRPTDKTEVANSGNVNPGVVNHEQGTPSWGQKLRL